MDSSITFRLASVAAHEHRLSINVCDKPAGTAHAPADERLIESICEGDKDALAVLFRRYAPLVRAVAFRILRDAAEADDLLQDIFLLVHRRCRTFDPAKSPARFWILQMAYCRAISRRRYLTHRRFYSQLGLDDAAVVEVQSSVEARRYEDTIEGVLGQGTLERMFAALSENQRLTLRLHVFEGYSFEEIAEKLGQTRSNVKNHYFRGLEKLRRQIFGNQLRGGSAV